MPERQHGTYLCEFRHQHPASEAPDASWWFELDLGVPDPREMRRVPTWTWRRLRCDGVGVYVIAFALCPDCAQYVRGGVA